MPNSDQKRNALIIARIEKYMERLFAGWHVAGLSNLKISNVEYEYKEWDELWHVFQLESLIPEAQESFSLISKFLNKYI